MDAAGFAGSAASAVHIFLVQPDSSGPFIDLNIYVPNYEASIRKHGDLVRQQVQLYADGVNNILASVYEIICPPENQQKQHLGTQWVDPARVKQYGQ
jgi:hypothetical protein